MQIILDWAQEVLHLNGNYTPFQSEVVVQTPWSQVIKIHTDQDIVYLQKTPALFALEPKILSFLHNKLQASVPRVLAENRSLDCFLMSHAGNNLRTRLKKQFNEDLVCRTIQQFVDFQLQATNYVNDLIAMGVPDYRLDQLPILYDALVADKALLAEEGFSETEITQFQGQSTQVIALCRKLSRYGVKPSVVQLDFNDNNTLIDDSEHTITMIDLGEIVITHPFVSLWNFLEQMTKHYGVTQEDDVYQQLQAIPYAAYADYCPHANDFHNVLATAEMVNRLVNLVYQIRFMQACGKENLKQHHQWKLKASLNLFSKALPW